MTVQWPDPDDTMRMVEVRDWLSGQGWFDVTQYRLNPPYGVQMHWSRLVDIPIAAIIILLTPLIGHANAEMASAIIVPLFTLLILMRIMAHITAQQFGTGAATTATILVAVTVPVIQQLQPMRIDHHGWQLVCSALALLGMLSPHARKGGLIAGTALAAWLTISLEGLPFAAACVVISCLSWVRAKSQENEGDRMMHLVTSLAVGGGLLYIATRWSLGWTTYCDALSPLHVIIFCISAAGIAATRALFTSSVARLCSLAFTAMLGVVVLLAIAPQCAGGSFANLDPIVRLYWYGRVSEGLPIWQQELPEILHSLAIPALGIAGVWGLWRKRIASDRVLITLAAVLLSAVLVAILVQRAAGVSSIVAIPSASWLVINSLRSARKIKMTWLRIMATVGSCLLLIPSLLFAQILPENPKTRNAIEKMSTAQADCVNHAAMQNLKAVIEHNGHGKNIMAPLDISPAIIENTGFTAVASGHHRNQSGMRDVILTFTSPQSVAKEILLKRNIDYFLYCPDLAEILPYENATSHGIIAQIKNGSVPSWLQPIEDNRIGSMKLYRVISSAK